VRVLLANPRWERRLLRFLELSVVGRVVADGTNENEAWTAKIDEWIVWEVGEEIGGPDQLTHSLLFLFFLFNSLCKGGSHPAICAQRNDEGEGSPMLWFSAGTETGFFCLFLCLPTYIPLSLFWWKPAVDSKLLLPVRDAYYMY
jgi:hypothetical protein